MNPLLILIAIVIVLFTTAMFVWKIASEKKAKKNYRPPVAGKRIVLPEMQDEQLPAKSQKNLRFCLGCGEANSDQSAYCTKCGNRL